MVAKANKTMHLIMTGVLTVMSIALGYYIIINDFAMLLISIPLIIFTIGVATLIWTFNGAFDIRIDQSGITVFNRIYSWETIKFAEIRRYSLESHDNSRFIFIQFNQVVHKGIFKRFKSSMTKHSVSENISKDKNILLEMINETDIDDHSINEFIQKILQNEIR